jgi:hypothetical protein
MFDFEKKLKCYSFNNKNSNILCDGYKRNYEFYNEILIKTTYNIFDVISNNKK